MAALAIKFYLDDATVHVYRFVAKNTEFKLGDLALVGNDFVGRVSGIGMEGKCLAVHLQKIRDWRGI